MDRIEAFYKEQLAFHSEKVQSLGRTLGLLSLLRLGLFLVTVAAVYWTFNQWQLACALGIAGTIVFLWLLSRYSNIKSQRRLHRQLVIINENELKYASGDFLHFPEGNEYLSPGHDFNTDIDLFGRGSFFQYLNRSGLKEGTDELARFLNSNAINDIVDKQQAIKELAEDPKWMQRYTALARSLKQEETPEAVANWLSNYKQQLQPVHRILGIGFALLSVVGLVLTGLELLPIKVLGYWLLGGLGITSIFLKRINRLAFKASKAKDIIRQYGALLLAIEERQFNSSLLQELQTQIHHEGLSASKIFKAFSQSLDALDHRNNLITAVLGNGLFLWDIIQSYRIERWISTYGHKAADWFRVVAQFDAYNSLGTFAFNHEDFVFPEILSEGALIKAEGLGHPLIRDDKRITSDFEISDDQFYIITGANMAGKSTFLRAVALHIVMANMGLPVCASASVYRPIKLISSMRTSDSLTDESSYFFSELTRLKYIVNALAQDAYFVILDEILKGTNSVDKAKGSQRFVERLLHLGACGIIATHDLSLTELEHSQKGVSNYFFDADIKNDELHFDYKLKEGVCQNMNASFLLRKMGIVE